VELGSFSSPPCLAEVPVKAKRAGSGRTKHRRQGELRNISVRCVLIFLLDAPQPWPRWCRVTGPLPANTALIRSASSGLSRLGSDFFRPAAGLSGGERGPRVDESEVSRESTSRSACDGALWDIREGRMLGISAWGDWRVKGCFEEVSRRCLNNTHRGRIMTMTDYIDGLGWISGTSGPAG